jgi:peptide deformylase
MAQGQVETTDSSAERDLHRLTALRLVRQYPDPALRSPARAVGEVDDEVRRLIERMSDIMVRSHGVGLAAPQIGVLRRVLVYRIDEEDVHALVDPRVEERSDELATDTEGCLSLLGGDLVVPVERSVRLRLTGLDGTGETVDVDLDGLAARIVQHEIDHLDGVLNLDRTSDEDRRAAMRELRLRATG